MSDSLLQRFLNYEVEIRCCGNKRFRVRLDLSQGVQASHTGVFSTLYTCKFRIDVVD